MKPLSIRLACLPGSRQVYVWHLQRHVQRTPQYTKRKVSALTQPPVTPTPAPPAASSITIVASTIAADVTLYGGPIIAVLEAVENVPGLLSVSAPVQGVVAGAVTVLTAIMSVLSQYRTETAVAEAKVGAVLGKRPWHIVLRKRDAK